MNLSEAMLAEIVRGAVCMSLPNGRLCGAPAAETVRVGCVHEHVKDVPACKDCASRLVDDGLGSCLDCYRDPTVPHLCDVVGRRLP